MSQYCDTKVLEENWFYWILAESVPELEEFRKYGLLWTRVPKVYKLLADPSHPIREHCIALGHPIFLQSQDGIVQHETIRASYTQDILDLTEIKSELNLTSDSPIHNLNNPFNHKSIINFLKNEGYFKERPVKTTWHAMLCDINKMCLGIAINFNFQIEEETNDLADEALLQVINKLKRGKLIYKPGKAPVFNLLTTTIYRCMYSIMNRRNNKKNGLNKLLEDAQRGVLPIIGRSIRVPSIKT